MIEIKGLCKSYGEDYLYKDFEIEFEEGKVTALLGSSGSGKTTLIRILLGIEKYEKGQILGLENKNIAAVFQEDRLIKWLDVYNNIAFVLKSYMNEDEMTKQIQNALELVELWEYKDYKISALSGGMQRRVSLARALAYTSHILILDEPFKGLDYELKMRVITKIKEMLKEEKRTTILITHDMEEAHLLGDVLYTFRDKPVKNYKI
nr:ATP-binding cassette domain-containing protein [uncultured Niameybacter sp.]